MKKLLSILLASIAMAAMVFTGCTVDDRLPSGVVIQGEKVVNLRVYKGGYGDEFIYEMIDAFNEMYAEEGYEINLVQSEITVGDVYRQEIETPKDNEIDLYLVNGSDMTSLITRSSVIMADAENPKDAVFEDLTELYGMKPIGLDKKEESKTIEQKIFPEFLPLMQYNGSVRQWRGNYYAIPWVSSSAGIVVNEKLLKETFKLDFPRTTDELYEQVQQISAAEEKDPRTGNTIYPIAWGGGNIKGYWEYIFEPLFAQYSGTEKYDNFYKFIPEDGDTITNGYEVYNDQGLLKALEVIDDLANLDFMEVGALNKDNDAVQHNLLTGQAVFMPTGDWVANEMKYSYADGVNNIYMIKMPIISALGTKLGLDADAEKCEKALREIVTGIDNGDDNAAIISAVKTNVGATVTEDQIEAVRDARGIYYNQGSSHQALIPSYADAKDVAKLFLRFMMSDDAMNIFSANTTGCRMPLNYSDESKGVIENETRYAASVREIVNGDRATIIYPDRQTSPLRSIGGLGGTFQRYWYYGHALATTPTLTAETIFREEYQLVSSNWSTYLSNAGLA